MGARPRKHDGGTLSLSQACYHAVYAYPGKVAAVRVFWMRRISQFRS